MAWFAFRAKGLQLKRLLANLAGGHRRLPVGNPAAFPFVIAESVSPLDTGVDPRERPLLLGKYQNLRVACRRLQHRVLRPGNTFSFWRQVGPPWGWRGFVEGREVREGCVIPTKGGGLCQLSGSLLEVAVQSQFELLERHRHTALPADVPYNERRDATLFWNYVDLRFRARCNVLFETFLSADALVVRLRSDTPLVPAVTPAVPEAKPARSLLRTDIQGCFVCGKTACARCQPVSETALPQLTCKTAYLVDQYQPEFDHYIQAQCHAGDRILQPFASHGKRTGWNRDGFAAVTAIPGFRLQQSLALRLAVARGISVAQAYFDLARSLARRYASRLDWDIEQLCISQALLPYLWQFGVLGGRRFDVLMYREPVALIERKLNAALKRYPDGGTLSEFRSPAGFVEAEQAALQAARSIITPHAQIASLFSNATRLEWIKDTSTPAPVNGDAARDTILFCGPTLARKGAHAVREAVRALGFTLSVLGADLEGREFWHGLPVVHVDRASLQWERVVAVLQPALFEYWPRNLLQAHAAGARLIISPACGIEEDKAAGIHHVPFGEPEVLIDLLAGLLANK